MNESYAPCIVRETSEGISRHTIREEMLLHREIVCVGEINNESAHAVILQLRYLQRMDPEGEITLYIDSPGGSVTAGLALYDVIRGITCPVRTVCMGLAASMGAVLFIAGKQRDMLPHARVMIHDPSICGGVGGTALAIDSMSRDLMKTRQTIGEIIALHSGKSIKEIFKKTAADTFFDAEEALAFGLADRIVQNI